jgi:hypothetical protein
MSSVIYAECLYAECLYAEYHYAECRYAECLYAECLYAECRGAQKSLFISGRLSHKFSVSSGRYSIQHNYTQYKNTQNKKPHL